MTVHYAQTSFVQVIYFIIHYAAVEHPYQRETVEQLNVKASSLKVH